MNNTEVNSLIDELVGEEPEKKEKKKKINMSKFIVETDEDDKKDEKKYPAKKKKRKNTVAKGEKNDKNRLKAAKKAKNMRNMSMYILGTVIKVVLYIALIVLVYFGCSKAYELGTGIFTESGVAVEGSEQDVEVVVTIPSGASTGEVAAILKENGLIEDEFIFFIQSILYEGEFYSGTYTLRTSYEPEMIVDILSGISVE